MANKPEDVLKNLATAMDKIDPKSFDYLLTEIPKRIRTRTRLGKGLLGTLKELSPNYIKFRTKYSGLSKNATPKKSNLTLTGLMLDSITGVRKGFKFKFFFNNDEARKKAIWADETGRPFFDLLPSEEKAIRRDVATIIRDQLRKIFKS